MTVRRTPERTPLGTPISPSTAGLAQLTTPHARSTALGFRNNGLLRRCAPVALDSGDQSDEHTTAAALTCINLDCTEQRRGGFWTASWGVVTHVNCGNREHGFAKTVITGLLRPCNMIAEAAGSLYLFTSSEPAPGLLAADTTAAAAGPVPSSVACVLRSPTTGEAPHTRLTDVDGGRWRCDAAVIPDAAGSPAMSSTEAACSVSAREHTTWHVKHSRLATRFTVCAQAWRKGLTRGCKARVRTRRSPRGAAACLRAGLAEAAAQGAERGAARPGRPQLHAARGLVSKTTDVLWEWVYQMHVTPPQRCSDRSGERKSCPLVRIDGWRAEPTVLRCVASKPDTDLGQGRH